MTDLYQAGKLPDPKFDWNAKSEEDPELTNADIVKMRAVRNLAPIATLISEGKKRGVEVTKEQEKELDSSIEMIAQQYGSNFEEALKQAGFETVELYKEIQMMQLLYQNAYTAFLEDPTPYMEAKGMDKYLDDDKVSFKHIIILYPEPDAESDPEAEISEEAKAETRKKAEEALARVKAGEDFDVLSKEYNSEYNAGSRIYTLPKDETNVIKAAAETKEGEVSGIVEEAYGFHIVKRVPRVADFEEYTSFLIENLKTKVNRAVYDKFVVDVKFEEYFAGVLEAQNAQNAE